MYARVLGVRFTTPRSGETVRLAADRLFQAAKPQPGFRGGTLLTSEVGRALLLTFWETEADLRAGDASPGVQSTLRRLAALLPEPPVSEVFHVGLSEAPQIDALAV